MDAPAQQSLRPAWRLGCTARFLTKPYTATGDLILNSCVLEAAFIQSSWVRQHALLAVFDTLAADVRSIPHEVADNLRRDFLRLGPTKLVRRWYGKDVVGIASVFHRLGADRPPGPGLPARSRFGSVAQRAER